MIDAGVAPFTPRLHSSTGVRVPLRRRQRCEVNSEMDDDGGKQPLSEGSVLFGSPR